MSFLIQQFNCQPQFQYGNPPDSIPLWVAAREDNTLSGFLSFMVRASPGLRIFPLYPLSLLSNMVIWPGSYQDGQIKKTPFQVSFLFGSFLSSQVHHRPGCLSYGKSKGFPFYNDLQPAETILCFRAKYFGVCELTFRVGMGATTMSCRCWLPFN